MRRSTSTRHRSQRREPVSLQRRLGLLLVLGCASCASYPERTSHALDSYRRGHFDAALVAYDDPEVVGSRFLRGAEGGMVAFTAGDFEGALGRLGDAAEEVEERENRALISPLRAAEATLSWVINERMSHYEGEGYERVMLHAMLGLCFLARGQVDGLLVEVLRGNALLESEEDLYDKDYRAGGLGHFLSAVAYELDGRLDDAYIDYKRLEEKGLGGPLVGCSLLRLSRLLGFQADHERWDTLYGPEVRPSEDAARVILIAGVGLGPYKRDATITIPTPDGVLRWAVPQFIERSQSIERLELTVVDEGPAVATVRLESVSRIAIENLEDRLAWLATKSTTQTFLKRELTKSLASDYGVGGQIAGDLFGFFSQQADLRAWQTLPDTWQACRVFLAPGVHELEIGAPGRRSTSLGRFELAPAETMFVIARAVGDRIFAYPLGGRNLDSGEPRLQP